ncbi:uncharacterized protein J3D65DRAFT_602042 [Phyllosticta citribraziliensis]|uniref:Uncharacterized protein n=1 Tax=Phyllosticta citribraziliensis TaxID=989973 RepID=A0ABR1LXX6_9PEZI
MPQCESFLASGQAEKCSKRAKPGQRFCHWHQCIQYTPDGDSVTKAKDKAKKEEEDEAENEDKQKKKEKKKKKNKEANKQAEPSDSEDSGQATPGDDPVLQLSPVVKRMLSRFKVDVKGKSKSKSDDEAEAEAEKDVEMLRRAIKAQKRQLENLAAAFDRLGVK